LQKVNSLLSAQQFPDFLLVTKLQLGNAPALQAPACNNAKLELVAPLRYAAGAA
jgi:hypothetical protein